MLCVRRYLKYPLSYRMTDRDDARERIDKRVRKHLKPTNDSWRMEKPILKSKVIMHLYIGIISVKTTLRKVKYLNHIIEQDQRIIKQKVKPILGFDSFETAQ